GMKYRFQWNFPILFSKYDNNLLYTAGNILFKSTNEGQSWEPISPDLTRNEPSMLGPSGGPITKDNTGVEYYCTIFTVAESSLQQGVIWTGSDDGLIHVTQDGGANWQNVTPPKKVMPEWIQINSIDADPFNAGGLYVAATMYKSDDFKPYLYKTTDFGKSWKKITNGIDPLHFTRVIRADPKRQGLLYAGTESGMYISFDDGASWKSFQLELPIVPITDLAIKDNDLIVATQGRSFWILDDLTPLHQLNDQIAQSNMHLFEPRPSYRMPGGRGFRGAPRNAGANPPNGVVLYYYLKEAPDSNKVALRIIEKDGAIIDTYKPKARNRGDRIAMKAGMNRFAWDMRYTDAERFPKMIMWAGSITGPRAVPGEYQARLIVGDDSTTVPFEILKDPRASSSVEDLQAQFDFLIAIRDKLTETHEAIKQIRDVRGQVNAVTRRLKGVADADTIKKTGKALLAKMKNVEEALYQTKNQSRQDPLNFPIRLNNKLAAVAGVASRGDYKPTDSMSAVRNDLTAKIDAQLDELRKVMATDLPAFNELVRNANIPAIYVEKEAETTTDGGNN
ncbi:MAG: WD40/YVTN/BNR-like repeat-containing protein, partial [bacterium]